MRILITGAHSTGKTTLAKELAKSLSIPFVTQDIFRNRSDKLRLNEIPRDEFDELEKKFIENTFFTQESFVTDSWGETVRFYSENSSLWNKKKFNDFDYIFFLFPEFPEEDDRFRPMDHSFRMNVSDGIFTYLRESHREFQILTGTVQQRISSALYHLGFTDSLNANSICFEGLPSSGKTTTIGGLDLGIDVSTRYRHSRWPNIDMPMTEQEINDVAEGHIDSLKTETGRRIVSDRGWMTVFAVKYAISVRNGIQFSPAYTMMQLSRMQKHDMNVFFHVGLAESIRRSALLSKRSIKKDVRFQANVLAGYEMILNNPSVIRLSGDAPKNQKYVNREIARHVSKEYK